MRRSNSGAKGPPLDFCLVMSQDQPVPEADSSRQLVSELTAVLRDVEANLLAAFDHYARINAACLNTANVTDQELLARINEFETRRPPAA